VILKCERCTEQGHDAIAHYLVHRAFVTVHRFHHAFENRIENFAGLFGVAVSE